MNSTGRPRTGERPSLQEQHRAPRPQLEQRSIGGIDEDSCLDGLLATLEGNAELVRQDLVERSIGQRHLIETGGNVHRDVRALDRHRLGVGRAQPRDDVNQLAGVQVEPADEVGVGGNDAPLEVTSPGFQAPGAHVLGERREAKRHLDLWAEPRTCPCRPGDRGGRRRPVD